MIIDDVTAGRFSLVGFYERRVRRIFPALAVLLLATSILAYLYLLPNELRSYARSLLAATFSYSNFYFIQQSGYFMPAVSTQPLLHTWSLAIEEQFYIFLPLFVLLVHRFWWRRFWLVLLGVTLISFALSIRSVALQDPTDFYLPQLRAWELLLGVLVGCPYLPALRSRLWREGAALLGAVLILVAAMKFTDATFFPGYAALLPCLGTALIIAAGRSGESHVGRLLSLPPMIFIGRISYSLYLWHWPVFVFLKLSEHFPAERSPTVTRILAVVVSLILATLSWRYVETPFRTGRRRPSRKALFATAGTAASVLAAVALGIGLMKGLPGRFSPQALAMAAEMNYQSVNRNYFRSSVCFLNFTDKVASVKANGCLNWDSSRKNYLLVGDSYAAHLWYGLSKVFDKINIMQATGAGCTPFPNRRSLPFCNELVDFLFNDYLLHHKPDRVIVAAQWLRSDLKQIGELLDWASQHGIRVVLMGPIVRYDDYLSRLLAFGIEDNDPGLADAHRLDYRGLDQAMRQLAEEKGATYVSLLGVLCQGATCEKFAAPGIPLQFDNGHLTGEGSLLVAKRLRAANAFPVDLVEVN
jgi:peptidoglycan/LPS O-acetylase OafA/YrhL